MAPDSMASNWRLEGFAFRNGCPMTRSRLFMAILTQPTFMPAGLKHGTVGQLRFRVNLRVIFEAVYHFSRFWGAPNFWPRIREALDFDPKTRDFHLQDLVNSYCLGRRAWLREHHDNRDLVRTRLEALADMINDLPFEGEHEGRPIKFSISQSQWQDLCPDWLEKLYQTRRDLGVLDEQMQDGSCAPILRKHIPALIGRFTEASPRSGKQNERYSPSNRFPGRSPSPDPPDRVQAATGTDEHAEQDLSSDRRPTDPAKWNHPPISTGPRERAGNNASQDVKGETRQHINLGYPNEVQSQPGVPQRPCDSAPKNPFSAAQSATRPEKRRHTEDEENAAPVAKRTAIDARPIESEVAVGQAHGTSAAECGNAGRDAGQAAGPRGDVNTENLPAHANHTPRGGETDMDIKPSNELSQLDMGPHTKSLGSSDVQANGILLATSEHMSEESQQLPKCSELESVSEFSALSKEEKSRFLQNQVADPSDAVQQLLISLELRQKRLEETEATMQAWQKQLAQQSAQQSHERINKLEARVHELSYALDRSEHKRISGLEILAKNLEGEKQQRTINRLRVEKLEDSIRAIQSPNIQSTMTTRMEKLEAQVQLSVKSHGSTQEQLIDMHTDIMGLTTRIDPLPSQEEVAQLKETIKNFETKLETYQQRAKHEQSSTRDLVKVLGEQHTELKDSVAQRSSEFELAVQEIVNHANAKTPDKDGLKKFREEFQDLRTWHSKTLSSMKERIGGLATKLENVSTCVGQHSVQFSTHRKQMDEHFSNLEKLVDARQHESLENKRISTIEATLKVLMETPISKVPLKRVEALEKTVNDLHAQADADAIKKDVNNLATAIVSLEEHLQDRSTEERTKNLEAQVLDLKSQIPQGLENTSELVQEELREVREYMDRSLEMANAASQMRLSRFQVQVGMIQKQIQAQSQPNEQLSTPINPVSDDAAIQRDARLTELQDQMKELREQLHRMSEASMNTRPLSPSISDLESIAGQPSDPKDFYLSVRATLRRYRAMMRGKIRELDSAAYGAVDEETKLSIAELAYDLGEVLKTTKSKDQPTS